MAEYDYDKVTDLFTLDGHPVPPPAFSPESGWAWECWQAAHELPDDFWHGADYDPQQLWREYHADWAGYVEWHGSEDSADSAADDYLDREYRCANCGGEPHDDDGCLLGYEPELAPEGTGEFAIIDWPHYQGYDVCRFAREADGDEDEEIWVLAGVMLVPGAEEGFYAPVGDLGDEKMLTIAQCRALAEKIKTGCLIGD
jgi:hypothetical protein